MSADPVHLAIRFGYGLSPVHEPPRSPAAMMETLRGPDTMAAAFPQQDTPQAMDRMRQFLEANRANRNAPTRQTERSLKDIRKTIARDIENAPRVQMVRAVHAPDPFRERLAAFWFDHFTVTAKSTRWRPIVPAFIETAIRPHVAGRFADMLKAVVTHPAMLVYLDQIFSVGPKSPAGWRNDRGLNENLARELLELHTLGVDGGYSQADVRQLAELLTGFSIDDTGFEFRAHAAEPGAETVLGRSYGGLVPDAGAVFEALEDLAVHPSTATHIAGKLAVHFVSDTPDPDLVRTLAERWRETGGDLSAVTGALVTHPASHAPVGAKAKRPEEFLLSAMRALGPVPRAFTGMGAKTIEGIWSTPLRTMGQPWQQAPGPDGWPERVGDWVTPQGLASRITWAMVAPRVLRPVLPDPRDFVQTALGPVAAPETRFAAGAAESIWEGVGLVLASPEFNRR